MLYPSFPPLNSVRWRRVRACGKPCLNLSVPSLTTGTLWPILFICLSLITTTSVIMSDVETIQEDEPVKQRRARRPKSTRQERAAEVSVSPPAISDLSLTLRAYHLLTHDSIRFLLTLLVGSKTPSSVMLVCEMILVRFRQTSSTKKCLTVSCIPYASKDIRSFSVWWVPGTKHDGVAAVREGGHTPPKSLRPSPSPLKVRKGDKGRINEMDTTE